MNLAFKRGVYHLNDQSNFDFQLNRIMMWDGGDLEEIQKIGSEIKTSEDWKRELIFHKCALFNVPAVYG